MGIVGETDDGNWRINNGKWKLTSGTEVDGINCLLKGTKILTLEGYKKIETLRLNDIIISHKNKELKITNIITQTVENNPDKENDYHLYYINKDSFGTDLPNETLFLSSDHEILIDNEIILPRSNKNKNIKKASLFSMITYYHLETETPCFLIANGLPVVSLQQKKSIIKNVEKKKIGIILTYQDDNDLDYIKLNLPNIINLFDDNKYFIYIIKQDNNKYYNRGYLYNIGFDLLKDDVDYFVFQYFCWYTETKNIYSKNISGNLVDKCPFYQNNNDKMYEGFFGGALHMLKEDFLKINGYSLNYKGIGCEDDDLNLRCIKNNIKLNRSKGVWSWIKDYVYHHDNPNYINNFKYLEQSKNNKINYNNDGYKQIKYITNCEIKLLFLEYNNYLEISKKLNVTKIFNKTKYTKLYSNLHTIRIFHVNF